MAKTQNPVYYERRCPDCGELVLMHIKSRRCPECQAKHNAANNAAYRQRKRDGISRIIGERYACERCGEMYELVSGLQRWCPACAPAMHKVVDRELSRKWNQRTYSDPAKREDKNAKRRRQSPASHVCPVCGKAFDSQSAHDVYCSPDCYDISVKIKLADYDKDHRSERNEYHRQRNRDKLAAMTHEQLVEYRQEVNRRARENYAKRKAKQEEINHD